MFWSLSSLVGALRWSADLFRNLNRGGYVEWHEFMLPACCTEATSTPTPHLIEWSRLLIEAAKKIGKDFSFPEKMASLLQDAGFVNVKIHWQHWPVGPWAKGKKEKDIGTYLHGLRSPLVGNPMCARSKIALTFTLLAF